MGNLEKIKNIYKETMRAQAVMILIYIVIFFIKESFLDNFDLRWVETVLLIFVAICPAILTKYYMKYDKEETKKIKRFIFTSIIWIIENIVICLCICGIVPGWWPLTYMILIGYTTIVPIIIILVCKVISYIYHKIKDLS